MATRWRDETGGQIDASETTRQRGLFVTGCRPREDETKRCSGGGRRCYIACLGI